MTKYLTVNLCELLKAVGVSVLILDCVKDGLDTDDMRMAKIKHTTATTASRAVVCVESGHLKQALLSG